MLGACGGGCCASAGPRKTGNMSAADANMCKRIAFFLSFLPIMIWLHSSPCTALASRVLDGERVAATVKIVDVLRDAHAFEVLPGAGADAVAGANGAAGPGGVVAEIGAPSVTAGASTLRQREAVTIGPLQAAKVGALA